MKQTFAYTAPDVAQLARDIARAAQTAQAEQTTLSHVQWLGVLAKAAGARNYQHWRAQAAAQASHANPESTRLSARLAAEGMGADVAPKEAAAIPKAVTKALGYFDDQGRLTRWPTQFGIQRLVLWGVWMRLRGGSYRWDERGITETLRALNTFDDPATLRRELIIMGMMERIDGGRAYWKVESPQPAAGAQAKLLMHLLKPRRLREGLRHLP